eukprot:TRINITY_DN22504_c0_g1_i1.p1 TRINITY_DN22504_c0_g1~~TRINITY_DN22504_c0_g1_i1.p1  ORF type:complete len:160 (-),score=12.74 TRINITY_DN22504_c0_g1_i1:350-829(-)
MLPAPVYPTLHCTTVDLPCAAQYDLEPRASSPPRLPWATRRVRLKMRRSHSKDMTVVNFLSLKQPHTWQFDDALKVMIKGHDWQLDPHHVLGEHASAAERSQFMDSVERTCVEIDPAEVEYIDWWCGQISADGLELRAENHKTNRNKATRLCRDGPVVR